MRDILSDLSAPPLSHEDPVRRAQIQMKQPLPKRFYTEASIGETEDGFSILLDGRPVRTPARNTLLLPTRRSAELVAAEWQAQEKEINPLRMPTTRLANAALDGVASALGEVFDDILRFAGTDMICYRAEAPEALVEMQASHWDPLLDWARERFGGDFRTANGIMHQVQSSKAIDAFSAVLAKHRTPLGLSAVHTVTTLTGSALIALAFAEGRLNEEEAWTVAHVDEDWNILQWGTDAEAHARREARWIEMQAAASLLRALSTV